MTKTEICNLILFSPSNLHDFFNKSFTIHDIFGLTKFANLKY